MFVSRRTSVSGFTLIELLIVVAIIAVLAAIAIPNYLQAQARAKVASARSGMRTIYLALNSYHVDRTTFPSQPNLVDTVAQREALNALTTPVAYISTVPADPFCKVNATVSERYPYYINVTEVDAIPGNAQEFNKFILGSIGPNLVQESAEALFDLWGNGWDQIQATGIYDPTNGTVSPGDIVRTNCSERGGASSRGGI